MPVRNVSSDTINALCHLQDFAEEEDGIPFDTPYVFNCSSLGYYLIMFFGILGWLCFMQVMCCLSLGSGLSLYWCLGQIFPAICFSFFMVACFEAFGFRVRRILQSVKSDHVALFVLFHVRPTTTYRPEDSINDIIIDYTAIEDTLFALLQILILYFLLGVVFRVASVPFLIGMLLPLFCNIMLVDALQEEFCRHILRISGAEPLVDGIHRMSLTAAYRQESNL